MLENRLRRSVLVGSTVSLLAVAAACSAPGELPGGSNPNGSAGQTASGGTVGSGGSVGSGGVGSGGFVGTGGASGGQVGTGGAESGGFAGSLPGTGGLGGGDPGGGGAGTGGGGTGGSIAGSAGTSSGGPWGNTECTTWPTATGTQAVGSTIEVSGTYDGGMKRFYGTGDLSEEDGEGLPAIFELSNGETLRNVIIGKPASDGVHCEGSCTLENVWWEDVGEDAASLLGSGSPTMTIDCGGARGSSDKVFQHNSGGTMIIRNFTIETSDKVYRSCGNCDPQPQRNVVFENITAVSVGRIAGINQNYGDTATYTNVYTGLNVKVCELYNGCEGCDEPTFLSLGMPGSQNCLYEYTDLHY